MAEAKKKFGKSNVDAVKERAADIGGGDFGNVNWINLDAGKNVIRVLPPLGDSPIPWADGWLHFGLGDDGKTTVTCRKTFGKNEKCPVCELAEQLKKSKSKADRKLGGDISMRKRFYLNVIDRDAEGSEKEYGVLGCGSTIVKEISALMTDPDYGDITDPEEGFDLTITKTGSGLNTEYKVIAKRNPSPIGGSLDEDELLETMADLSGLFVEKTYEELQSVLDGTEADDDDDSAADEDDDSGQYDSWTVQELIHEVKDRGAKPVSTTNKVKLIAQLEQLDEDDGSADEEEPEEPPKSGKGTGNKSGKSKNTEANDDEDADEIEAALKRAAGNKGKNNRNK